MRSCEGSIAVDHLRRTVDDSSTKECDAAVHSTVERSNMVYGTGTAVVSDECFVV